MSDLIDLSQDKNLASLLSLGLPKIKNRFSCLCKHQIIIFA